MYFVGGAKDIVVASILALVVDEETNLESHSCPEVLFGTQSEFERHVEVGVANFIFLVAGTWMTAFDRIKRRHVQAVFYHKSIAVEIVRAYARPDGKAEIALGNLKVVKHVEIYPQIKKLVVDRIGNIQIKIVEDIEYSAHFLSCALTHRLTETLKTRANNQNNNQYSFHNGIIYLIFWQR